MLNTWFGGVDWSSENTPVIRSIWNDLIDYLESRSHEERLSENGQELENWYQENLGDS